MSVKMCSLITWGPFTALPCSTLNEALDEPEVPRQRADAMEKEGEEFGREQEDMSS